MIEEKIFAENGERKKRAIGLIHKIYLTQLKNRRKHTASTKTKSEVRGGGRKPWKQKGKKIISKNGGYHECIKYTITKASLDSTDTRDQEEYNFAMAQLIRLLPKQLQSLPTKIEYYENDFLLKQFNKKKQIFESQSNKKHTPIWVFHGTNIANVESIMLNGFQVGGFSCFSSAM